jgi:hypothetical protein
MALTMAFTTLKEQSAQVREQANSVEDHDEEAEPAMLTSTFDEQPALADAQKTEIVAGGEQAKSVQDDGDAVAKSTTRRSGRKQSSPSWQANSMNAQRRRACRRPRWWRRPR